LEDFVCDGRRWMADGGRGREVDDCLR